MKKTVMFYDSHKKFKPFTVTQEDTENERQFYWRTWKIFSELVDKHETPADGERVYMKEV